MGSWEYEAGCGVRILRELQFKKHKHKLNLI
jgi:hypothetical protein